MISMPGIEPQTIRLPVFLRDLPILVRSQQAGVKDSALQINQSIIQLKRLFFHACTSWTVWPTRLPPRIPANRPQRRTLHLPPPLFTHWTIIGRSTAHIRRNRPTGTSGECAAGRVSWQEFLPPDALPATNPPNDVSSGRTYGSSFMS